MACSASLQYIQLHRNVFQVLCSLCVRMIADQLTQGTAVDYFAAAAAAAAATDDNDDYMLEDLNHIFGWTIKP